MLAIKNNLVDFILGIREATDMKIPYSFSVLRYIHDVVTGEFANVGVVLFAPGQVFKCYLYFGTEGYRQCLKGLMVNT